MAAVGGSLLDKSIRCRCRHRNCHKLLNSLAPHGFVVRAWRASKRSASALPYPVRFEQQPVLRRLRASPESMRIPTPHRGRSRSSGADRHCSLTVAFGDLQRERLRGTQQLVPRGPTAAPQALGHLVSLSQIPDRNPVDSELLMTELLFFSDYDNDNVCIPCATYR
jgi:hypothetical protein